MEYKFEDYKFVIKITYSNHPPMYYNGGNYMLVSNPFNASRYLTSEAAQKDVNYASCQGGEGSVSYFDTEKKEYIAKMKEINEYE